MEGHAGYARHGKDIVCAAVTAIVFTALGALQEMVGIDTCTENEGYIKCSIPSELGGSEKQTVKIILDTMVIGLRQIKLSYKKFISILDEEV